MTARKPSRGWRPGNPRPYRPNPSLRGDAAVKLHTALEASGVSASQLITALVNRLEVDAEGWPLDENGERFVFSHGQETLRLTGT